MNSIENRDEAAKRLESYRFLSYIFLALPNKDFVNGVFNMNIDNSFPAKEIGQNAFEGMQLIKGFILANKLKTLDAVFLELSVDRTKLLRGLSEEGPRPPYESVYLKKPPQEILIDLAKIYGKGNSGLRNDVHESPEQIGIELSFMAELCEKEVRLLTNKGEKSKELKAIRKLQTEFLKNHLGKWVLLYADEIVRFAKTDFYRGVALMLKGFMEGELEYLS